MDSKNNSLYDYCIERRNTKLLEQWDADKNSPLTPHDVARSSHRKVWWVCEKGHEWQATIASRVSKGRNCPVCAGKIVIPGENDLASAFPNIAAQWHPTNNGTLTPDRITPQSNKVVWWICELGHEYRAAIQHRTNRIDGCPYCSGSRVLSGFNDLVTKEPIVAAQWHPELNGNLTPEMVTTGSNKKVWWQCPDGHVWKARIDSRATGKKHGCPVCAGNVKKKRY